MPDFESVLGRARDDENVVGVILSGARGRARDRGLGGAIDAWEPNVGLLRGD